MRGMAWEEQCALIARAGYRGIEVAPFSVVRESIAEIGPARRREMVRAMKDAGLECAGLHWLLTPPPPGLHITAPDREVRKKSWGYIEKLIDFCGDLGGTVLVLGSPKGRSTTGGLSAVRALDFLAEGLAGVAGRAGDRGVSLLLEPLGREQTDVVNTLAEAVEIVSRVSHPSIRTMFDFHNTADEADPPPVLLEKFFPFIRHVHVQEMDGRCLGFGSAKIEFVAAFQRLKDLGYNRWISVEVFDFAPGPLTIAGESIRTLRAIEGKLV